MHRESLRMMLSGKNATFSRLYVKNMSIVPLNGNFFRGQKITRNKSLLDSFPHYIPCKLHAGVFGHAMFCVTNKQQKNWSTLKSRSSRGCRGNIRPMPVENEKKVSHSQALLQKFFLKDTSKNSAITDKILLVKCFHHAINIIQDVNKKFVY